MSAGINPPLNHLTHITSQWGADNQRPINTLQTEILISIVEE